MWPVNKASYLFSITFYVMEKLSRKLTAFRSDLIIKRIIIIEDEKIFLEDRIKSNR